MKVQIQARIMEPDWNFLAQMAEMRGKTLSEIVREALEDYVDSKMAPAKPSTAKRKIKVG